MTSCIEKYDAELPSDQSNALVVEGTILSDTITTFYLSRGVAVNSSYSSPAVVGATLQIVGSDGSVYPFTSESDGVYTCATPKLSADVEYSLHIATGGETFESTPQKPLRTVGIEAVYGAQNTKDSDIDVLITTDTPDDPTQTQYYSWHYDETWEVRPEIISYLEYNPKKDNVTIKMGLYPERGWLSHHGSEIIATSSTFYHDNKISGYKLYDIRRDNQRLYVLYSTNIIQRSITKAEYEYEAARRQVSAEMGGLFTPQPSALPSNIICTSGNTRVIGYVGCAFNIVQKRAFFDCKDFSIERKYTAVTLTQVEDSPEVRIKLYENDWRVYEWEDNSLSGGGLDTKWARHLDLDIRLQGCTVVKPEYWPY